MAAPQDAPATTDELKSRLEQLKAAATQQYALKNYSAAAESFSEAAEVQDQINGEMVPENADLLYQYGRCLYHVAVSKSDVLGGKVASAEEPKRKKRKLAPIEEDGAASGSVIGEALTKAEEQTVDEAKNGASEAQTSKPFFQITGDENFTDDEDEDAEQEADAEAEEEEDDFAIAYEILDVARILLTRKLAALDDSNATEIRQTKERLADTHDLQAEISLENERFHDAINDSRDALNLKLELYPPESSLVAEAHFKLSLALEFASVTTTTTTDPSTASSSVPAQIDESLREEAASELQKAITSCRLRLSKEESATSSLDLANKPEHEKLLTEVKEMIAEMEQRLHDLRAPPPALSLSALSGAGAGEGEGVMRGVLGAMAGQSEEEQKRRVREAMEKANDVTGLVKHRKKEKGKGAETGGAEGKRKAEEIEEGDGAVEKRARTNKKVAGSS